MKKGEVTPTEHTREAHFEAISKSLHRKVELLRSIHKEALEEKVAFVDWVLNGEIKDDKKLGLFKARNAAKAIFAEVLQVDKTGETICSDNAYYTTLDELLELIEYIACMLKP
jgi:hypothetical protein